MRTWLLLGHSPYYDVPCQLLCFHSFSLLLSYYDAPVKRENRPEFAVVCFGDIDKAHELASEDHPTFTKAVAEVCV